MSKKSREMARIIASAAAGIAASLTLGAVLAYLYGWLDHYGVYEPWYQLLIDVCFYDLPLTLLAILVGIFTYKLILRPVATTETRCRACGYILKGLSRPECPECGEGI